MSFDWIVYLGLPATGSDDGWAPVPLHPDVPLLWGADLLGPEPLGPADSERLRPGAAAALGAALASLRAVDARVVLPIRRQDHLMEYAHLHAVRAGSASPFAEQFPYSRDSVLDWGDLAARLCEVRGVSRVDLVPVEANPAAAVFDALVDAGHVGGECVAGDPAPVSTYSARGIRVARALNAHVASDAERDLVREFVAATFPGPPGPNLFLSAATRARVVAAYRDANRRLFREWLPEYPEDAWIDAEEQT